MAFGSMVQTAGCTAQVSSRLKRSYTILDKLTREPTMQLANMEDIGGVRAIVRNLDELRASRAADQEEAATSESPGLHRGSSILRLPRSPSDHLPRGSRRNRDRSIEVQLRTPVMHEWAIAVERLSGRMGEDLKGGHGPEGTSVAAEPASNHTF